eukprot:scaffold292585_cov23-Tisochrysis_lutea.AAC.5
MHKPMFLPPSCFIEGIEPYGTRGEDLSSPCFVTHQLAHRNPISPGFFRDALQQQKVRAPAAYEKHANLMTKTETPSSSGFLDNNINNKLSRNLRHPDAQSMRANWQCERLRCGLPHKD